MSRKPSFTKSPDEDQHFILLKEAVKEQLGIEQKKYQNQFKAFLLPSLYFLFWFMAMQYTSFPFVYLFFYGLMGVLVTLIFVNLIHEACHYTLFKEKGNNKAIMYLFDCIGANSFIWINRHVKMHHNYPNTIGWDTDIEQGGPLKLFPSDKHLFIQKYQHYWVFFLYPLFLLNWLLVRDFRDFYSAKRYIRKFVKIPLIEYYKLWFFKLLFICYTILIPIFVFNVSIGQALLGFLIQMICGSLVGLIILIPSHANAGNEFPIPNAYYQLPTTWLRHQFITTNDVHGENFISKHIMNNFNFHLAHHLFPNISAAQAAQATQIIKAFAKEYNFPYKSYSLSKAFQLHYQLVKKNAINPESIFEETM